MAFLAAINAGRRGGLTPVAQLTASREFNRFLRTNALAFDSETSIAWLMLEAVDTALGADANVPRVPNDQAALCARRVAPNNVAAAAAAAAPAANEGALFDPESGDDQALQEGIPVGAFRSLLADADKAIYWLLDLAACHQVKPLKAINIANFFRMSSRVTINGREILKVIDYAAVTLPNIMGNDELSELLTENQFMTYHTAYSSSAKLAVEMIESAPALTHLFFTGDTRAAVAASANDPSSRVLNAAIPAQVLLATYAYLVAFGKLPDNWFQGEKAKTSLPANKYNVYLAVFRRLRALSADTDAINNANDVASLIQAIGNDMRNV